MQATQYGLVSRRVLDGEAVGLMYRERAFGADDSGWRIFVGDESGEYVADPRNVVMVPLAEIAEKAPDAAQWFEQPVGAAIERDAQGRLALCT